MSQADFEYMQNEADHSLEFDRKVEKTRRTNNMSRKPRLLPDNVRKAPKETPRNFLIYGGPMHGKTYFADEFPNPLNLNTDGNAEAIETPSIHILNERGLDGSIKKTAFEQLGDIINEIESTNHTFETIILDVTEDIITLFEQEILEEHGVKSIGDIGYGRGHAALESMVRALVMKLKGMTMAKNFNVIYTSRLTTFEDNNVTRHVPSLKEKWVNIVNGNSDYTILCQKIGRNYIRRVESKRKNYTRDMVDDEQIKSLLDTVVGAYDRSQKTSVGEAKKIVEQQEQNEEQAVEQVPKTEAPQTPPAPTPKASVQPEPSTPVETETAEEVKEDLKEEAKEEPPIITPPRQAPTKPAVAVETPTTRTARPAPRPARPPRRAR